MFISGSYWSLQCILTKNNLYTWESSHEQKRKGCIWNLSHYSVWVIDFSCCVHVWTYSIIYCFTTESWGCMKNLIQYLTISLFLEVLNLVFLLYRYLTWGLHYITGYCFIVCIQTSLRVWKHFWYSKRFLSTK